MCNVASQVLCRNFFVKECLGFECLFDGAGCVRDRKMAGKGK